MAPPGALLDPAPPSTEDTAASTILTDRFSINGVTSRRAKAPQLGGTIAVHASSDMFKGAPSPSKPKAKRWDQYITVESAARGRSTLKTNAKYLTVPGMISLGGGLPSSEYFPFESMDIKVPKPPAFSETETREGGMVAHAGKHDFAAGKSLFDINIAFNYGQSTGSAQLLRFVTEHIEIVHNPPYADWHCSLTVGSTSCLDMCLRMLCVRGDSMLSEEYTFSSAVETAVPMGIKVIGVAMDAEGLLPASLDSILLSWNVTERGSPKPRLLYTVPTGQNPTGATQSTERRRQIYAIAQKHDLIIIEDEPYYFLQMQPYASASTSADTFTVHAPTSHADFLSALIPSFLSMDVDGRVIRLDSFSKIVSPGARVGWVTACEQLVERLVRHAEVSTQFASGMSQLLLYKLLEDSWGHAGFLDWLMFIRSEYTRRRDVICRACEEFLPTEVSSWVPPTAGMFHWIQIDWRKHPIYVEEAESLIGKEVGARLDVEWD